MDIYKRVHKTKYGKECQYKDCLVKDTLLDKEDQCLKIFNKLVLPLDRSKKDMYDISLQHGFNHILDMTWSCYILK